MQKRLTAIVISVLVLSFLGLIPRSAEAQAKRYRKALQAYWEKVFKEEGLSPIYYASTIHEPKVIWAEKKGAFDFYSDGIALYPESLVPVQKAPITLPSVSRESKIAFGLQLAGVEQLGDAEFEALVNSSTEWSIEGGEAEMHFFAKFDAKVAETQRSSVLQQLLALSDNARLWVTVKAVSLKSSSVSVSGSSGVSLDLGNVLQSLGFNFDREKKTASALTVNDRYIAVGLRRITESGLTAGGSDSSELPPRAIDLPTEPWTASEGSVGI